MVEWVGEWRGGGEEGGWGIELLKFICWPMSVSDRPMESGWAWGGMDLKVWR